MRELNSEYAKFLAAKRELEKSYLATTELMKKKRLKECVLQPGMIVKYMDKVGRIKYVDFIGMTGNEHIQAMFVNSENASNIPIDEKEFTKIERLCIAEKEDVIHKVNRLKNELNCFRETSRKIIDDLIKNNTSAERIIVQKIENLTEKCIHDWKLTGLGGMTPTIENKIPGCKYIYVCKLCGRELSKPL